MSHSIIPDQSNYNFTCTVVCKLMGTKWENLQIQFSLTILVRNVFPFNDLLDMFWHWLNQFGANVFQSNVVEPHFYHVRYHALFSWTVHFTRRFFSMLHKFSFGFMSGELPGQLSMLIFFSWMNFLTAFSCGMA
jgi:hypothetical protein